MVVGTIVVAEVCRRSSRRAAPAPAAAALPQHQHIGAGAAEGEGDQEKGKEEQEEKKEVEECNGTISNRSRRRRAAYNDSKHASRTRLLATVLAAISGYAPPRACQYTTLAKLRLFTASHTPNCILYMLTRNALIFAQRSEKANNGKVLINSKKSFTENLGKHAKPNRHSHGVRTRKIDTKPNKFHNT